jgi:hypothetical protein
MVQVKVDWDACKKDPVEFAKVFLRKADGSVWTPHPAQANILRGVRRTTTCVTGRQFGKSEGFAGYAAWFGATHSHRNVWIFAPTLEQAKIIFNEIAQFFRNKPLSDMVDGKIMNSPFPHFKLKNGTEYQCRGLNSPNNGRGNRAHLAIVDEAAFIKDGSLKDVIEPMFTVTGKQPDSALVLVSTPFGAGEFKAKWDVCGSRLDDGNTGRFARFHYTSYDNPYADIEFLEEVKAQYGEDSPLWLAEYMGVFQDDELSVFSTADIKAAYEAWPEGQRFPIPCVDGHRYVQGLDLANQNDYFVSTVLDVTSRSQCVLSYMDRYRKRGYPFYKSRARSNYKAYNRARTIIDATSLGESVAQDLADISVVPYTIGTNAAKWEIVQECSRMFQERRIVIPFHKDIIAELTYFRYKVNPSGQTLGMEAPRGKHDDIVLSLSLGAHLAAVPVMVGSVRTVSMPGKPTQRRELTDHQRAWLAYIGGDDAA